MQPVNPWGSATTKNDGTGGGITPPPAPEEGTVSLHAEVPEPLLQAMQAFIERHPNWDQYRLFQAALAGFLVQNGVRNRGITRCYLANLFPGQASFSSPAPPPLRRSSAATAASGWPSTPAPSRVRSQHQVA